MNPYFAGSNHTPPTSSNLFYMEKDVSPHTLTPTLRQHQKKSPQRKSKNGMRSSRGGQKPQFHNATTNKSPSPYKILLDKFKGAKASRANRTKGSYASGNKANRSHSPYSSYKPNSRSESKHKKQKTTSTLTRWLQKLLESHSEKTKQRNVIDYFIYAIYTVLADTNRTRDRISS